MASGGKREGAGRKPGSKSPHTLDAIAVKTLYIDLAKQHALPVANALLEKAVSGDVGAIKEFNDRAFGKAPQAIQVEGEVTLKIDV